MRIALLGGSFDPPHIGHLALADEVCSSLGYDRVLFVPSYLSPHKQPFSISPEHRIAMLEISVADDERFFVERCEIEREGISYTIDTVEHILQKYAGEIEEPLGLVMGQENAAEFHKWKASQKIAEKCDIIVAKRKNSFAAMLAGENADENGGRQEAARHSLGYSGGIDESGEFLGVGCDFKWKHTALDNFLVGISSSEIRFRIGRKKSWKYLVPRGVFDYIKTNGLYGYEE